MPVTWYFAVMSQHHRPAPDEDLALLRAEIDAADRALVTVLAVRRDMVRRMRAPKARPPLSRLDPDPAPRVREGLLAEGRRQRVPAPLLERVLAAVLDDSRALVGADEP